MKKLFYLFMVTVCAAMFTSCSKDDDKDPWDDNGGNGSKEGMITMVVAKGIEEISIWAETFNEGDIITIDWGDGKVEELKSFRYDEDDGCGWYRIGNVKYNDGEYEDVVEHKYYRGNKSYTIKIKGKIKGFSCGDDEYVLPQISLDVSKCTALTFLDCSCSNLTSLDVSKNIALETLYCSGNDLTSLDVSKNTALDWLICSHNNLTSLDVSKNTALTELWCEDNNFSVSALNQIFKDLPQGKTWTENGYTQQSTIIITDNPGTATCDKSIATNKGWEVWQD